MIILDACLVFSECGSSQYVLQLGPTSVFILTLQACVWFVHRWAVQTLITQQPGLNDTSRIAGRRSFQNHGMNLI
jgi:hypothetical protein